MTRIETATSSKWVRPARTQRLLTAQERRFRDVKEADFQRQVTDLAEALGWTWCHWRPLRNGRGIWQVPVEGPLGKGWPDLTLLRSRDRRLMFVELKRETEDAKPEQVAVLTELQALDHRLDGDAQGWASCASVEVHLWRPSDLADPIETSVIGKALR